MDGSGAAAEDGADGGAVSPVLFPNAQKERRRRKKCREREKYGGGKSLRGEKTDEFRAGYEPRADHRSHDQQSQPDKFHRTLICPFLEIYDFFRAKTLNYV